MKKVLHLTNKHVGFDDRIFYKEAICLSKKYDVYILSPGRDGDVIDMGLKNKSEGIYSGVKQYAYDIIPMKNYFLRAIRKLLRKLGFWKYHELKIIMKKLDELELRPDIIHLHDYSLIYYIEKFKKKYGCSVIFDCHEYYYLYDLDINKFRLSSILSYLKLLRFTRKLRIIDGVISVNTFMKHFNMLLVQSKCNHEVIENKSIFKQISKKSVDIDSKVWLVHEGSMKFNRGLILMCDIFIDEWIRSNVRLKIIGKITGPEKKYIEKRKKNEPWLNECIVEIGWVDYENLNIKIEGDIGIVFIQDSINAMLSIPIKVYNYLASGLPIITTKIPLTKQLVEEYGFGIAVDKNAFSIKDAIRRIHSEREKYLENIEKNRKRFEWNVEEIKLLEFYKKIELLRTV